MSNAFKKIAEERAKRMDALYEIDEEYAPFSRTCETCRVQKELLDTAEKKKLGLSQTEAAWRCPECKEVTEARGSIDEQTDGFSKMNHDTNPGASIADEDGKFKDMNSVSSDSERKIRE